MSPLDESRQRLRDAAQDALGWAPVTALAHRAAADYWTRIHYALGLPAVVLSAVAGTSALAEFDGSNVIAGALALIVAALTGLSTFLNPQKNAQDHQRAARRYDALDTRARRFIFSDLVDRSKSDAALQKQFRELDESKLAADEESPHVSRRRLEWARHELGRDFRENP